MNHQLSRFFLVFIMALVPISASAQNHAYGTAWIHRDAPMGTMVHAAGDTLCMIEFPAFCYHGMMRPDSLLCSWQTVPSDSMPDPMANYCVVAVHCEIGDEHGEIMMPGHMTEPGMFQNPPGLTIHYDPVAVVSQGIDVGDLVLTTWIDGAATIVESAAHDVVSARFAVSAPQLVEWYGISDRTNLPTSVAPATWGQIKATLR